MIKGESSFRHPQVFRLTAASFLIGAVAGVVVYAAVAMLVIGHVWPHHR